MSVKKERVTDRDGWLSKRRGRLVENGCQRGDDEDGSLSKRRWRLIEIGCRDWWSLAAVEGETGTGGCQKGEELM